MPQDNPPGSPTVVITQKMTAGKLALAGRPPISTILSENGIKVPEAGGSIKKKKKRASVSADASASAKKKKLSKTPANPVEGAPAASAPTEETVAKKWKSSWRKGSVASTPVAVAKETPAKKSKASKSKFSTSTPSAAAPAKETPAKKASAKKKRTESEKKVAPTSSAPAAPTGGLASLRSRKKDRKKKNMRAKSKTEAADAEASVSTEDACVVYIGHIPHGFYEREMRSYFAQFGTVSRLRLSRSRRTGASRGFAFVEFDEPGTAATAADAMDGYMMHGRRLRAALVPPARLHASTFLGANRKFTEVDWAKKARDDVVKRSKNPLAVSNRDRAVRKRLKKRGAELKALGIDYQMPTIPA